MAHSIDSLPEALTELLQAPVFQSQEAREIARIVHEYPVDISEFNHLIFSTDEFSKSRLLWSLNCLLDDFPQSNLDLAELERLWNWLQEPHRAPGELRHGLKLFLSRPIPLELIEEMVSPCFDWMASPLAANATRVYSMQLLWGFCQHYPELTPEFVAILEQQRLESGTWFRQQADKHLAAARRFR